MATTLDDLSICSFHELTISSSFVTIPQIYLYDLPDELLVEILKRLPQNLVHWYRCVSKRWLEVLSSEIFISGYIRYNSYLANSKPPFALFYDIALNHPREKSCGYAFSENPLFKSPGFTFDFLSLNNVNFLSSSSGIVLCKLRNQFQYCVCNPLTKQWITIPQPPSSCLYRHLGFIYKSSSNGCSFRIVHPSRSQVCRKFEVYESESKQWTEKKFDKTFLLDYCHSTSRSEAIASNGLLHWKNSLGLILVYDPYNGGDNYKIIHVPDDRYGRNKNSTIGVCNERLMYLEREPDNFLLWGLEDYDTEKWSLIQKVRVNGIEIDDSGNINKEDWLPLAIHPCNDDVIFLQARDQIVWCHMRLKKVRIAYSLDNYLLLRIYPVVLPWWPILVS